MKTLRMIAMVMLLAVLSLSCSTNDGDIVQRETIYATSSAMQDDEFCVDSTMEGELLPNGVTLKKVDSLYLYQGDILLTYDQAMSLTPIGGSELRASISTDAIKYWRNRTVYYTYSPGFNLRDNVERAIREWESKTALKFLKGTGKGDYITFTQGSGLGASSLGMVGGEQKIFLGRGSTYGTAIHEIGHAMGLIHEQCRNDRDKFITILWQNIGNDPDTKFQFQLRPAGEVQDIGPFDFSSVMLYSSYAGANEYGKPAMVTKDGRTFVGQRTHLSTWDVEGKNLSMDLLFRSCHTQPR